MGVGISQMETMKPMMLDALYAETMYLKINNLTQQPEAVDLFFEKQAQATDKKIIPLETLDQQATVLFNSLPLKRQSEILVRDIKEQDKTVKQTELMDKAYLTGNMDEAEQINTMDDSMTPEERKPLIEDRNNRWMQLLPPIFQQQSCFVAVGFLHLAGETGLVNQLRKAGYTVEPVIFK